MGNNVPQSDNRFYTAALLYRSYINVTHIKKTPSLNSRWWCTQLNTSKVFEMDCSVLWKPKASSMTALHSTPDWGSLQQSVCLHWRWLSTDLRMVLWGCSGCPLQFRRVQMNLGRQVNTVSVTWIYLQTVPKLCFAAFAFVTEWSVVNHCQFGEQQPTFVHTNPLDSVCWFNLANLCY